MFDPKIFYASYLHDYHKFKSILLKSILENPAKYETEFFGEILGKEDHKAFQLSLKSDLRQNYFHGIETFFEIFFTLTPSDSLAFDDINILYNLANSNWHKNFEKIKKIATGELSLDFLSKKISFQGHEITIGHYLYYFGLIGVKSIPNLEVKISESVDAIKHGIKIIASDFIDRDEYNSYKHGLRVIPALSELIMLDPKTKEIKIKWSLDDSMSFFCKTKNENEIKLKTKVFDSDRDFHLTHFCSNMISNMIYTRKTSFYKEDFIKKGEKIAIAFFGKKEIDECNKINVPIQDFVYKITRN